MSAMAECAVDMTGRAKIPGEAARRHRRGRKREAKWGQCLISSLALAGIRRRADEITKGGDEGERRVRVWRWWQGKTGGMITVRPSAYLQ